MKSRMKSRTLQWKFCARSNLRIVNHNWMQIMNEWNNDTVWKQMFVHHVAQNWPFTVRGRLCATRWWSCVLFRPQNISVDEFKPSSGRHFFLTHMHAGTCIISNNIETLFLFRSRVVLSLACRSFNWTAWRVGAWDDLLFLHNASSVTEAIQNPRIKCGKMSNSILPTLWNLLVQYVTLTKPRL